MSSYFSVGKIVATFGLGGEMILLHKLGRTDALQGVDTLFVENRRDSFLPYFPSAIRAKNEEEVYLALEGVETVEAARKLLHKRVYLEESLFRGQVGPESTLYYLGFTVADHAAGVLGTVAEVVEMPSQLLVKVFQDGRELLIPLNESTLEEIDREGSVIRVRLPEGLLDIYRG